MKEGNNMKIAISASGKSLENNVSEIFARCPYFIIVEIKDGKIDKTEIVENESVNQMGGAGISVAQLMAEKDVNTVITGNVGPRAFDILRQFGVEVYQGQGKVKDAIEKFLEGKLEKFE
jgi:predicted Fe-Mo cluster-binding NifX family protein